MINLVKPMGTLLVSGADGATVSVDGQPAGPTPIKVQLPAGEHKVVVEKDGRKIYDAVVKLMEDDIREITTKQD